MANADIDGECATALYFLICMIKLNGAYVESLYYVIAYSLPVCRGDEMGPSNSCPK